MTRMSDRRFVWGLRVVAGVVGVLSLALASQAELSPREYRRMQREAHEEVRIEVFERLLRRPESFEVRYQSLSGSQMKLVRALGRALTRASPRFVYSVA